MKCKGEVFVLRKRITFLENSKYPFMFHGLLSSLPRWGCGWRSGEFTLSSTRSLQLLSAVLFQHRYTVSSGSSSHSCCWSLTSYGEVASLMKNLILTCQTLSNWSWWRKWNGNSVLVEMGVVPKHSRFDSPVPLSSPSNFFDAASDPPHDLLGNWLDVAS